MIIKSKIGTNVSPLLKTLYKVSHEISRNLHELIMFQIPELAKGFISSAKCFDRSGNNEDMPQLP